ncbi:hypothetical protein [Roseateles violae]|uniref:Uncharacterized protein n=1 Tax=Roseateles violae TaxID=3058042 RepID=A0ABT8DWE5_9BURK|nr:hypothetical protein [Pelomonas sp. PFR6]MDN3920491.1 hypothetical protein [Pelomonas sp. PFR6]
MPISQPLRPDARQASHAETGAAPQQRPHAVERLLDAALATEAACLLQYRRHRFAAAIERASGDSMPAPHWAAAL